MTRPSIYHSEGYTCAEALIKSYNEEHKTNIPVSLGSGLGVGMTVGSVCGAVNAAAIIIGFIKGRNDKLEQNEARKYTKELMNKVREKYNSEICLNLKRNKVGCDEIINFTYDALNELLESEK
ncbi:oxidoreductase [Romboutsia maritimum]|uniref:Oxidoreductase n=1 Tax=Romboutsia maritimum TaxID=2020948 RepID=A0A371ISA9_9FIRM|nr:C-GCAxxG-C-C family (seleno)protein [Romboutsia maritimum]RDY23343.1 oxidoreductase [Romboutsia maritimum]